MGTPFEEESGSLIYTISLERRMGEPFDSLVIHLSRFFNCLSRL